MLPLGPVLVEQYKVRPYNHLVRLSQLYCPPVSSFMAGAGYFIETELC